MYHFSNRLIAKSKLGRKEKYKHYKWGKFETIFDCVVQKKKTSFFFIHTTAERDVDTRLEINKQKINNIRMRHINKWCSVWRGPMVCFFQISVLF